ncbi:UNVERIFIED_CONTAM: hypothetical protein Sradi_3649900 [Sesamum radiatum]|uniref:CCHC-type domain-containing protein n=1 Tax=Sesamum radiatum TaxID=300843 RepID=A0AAW2QK07_SESRA
MAQENAEGKERALYYLSRTLTESALKYSPVVKVCLALFYAIKKLRHYFEAYSIRLLSRADPSKLVMPRPILFGRLAKWSILSNQYEIEYVPQKATKGQVLANFLADHLTPTEWETSDDFPDEDVFFVGILQAWTMFFDRAARSDGAGAALEIGLIEMEVYGDSKLIINQLLNIYEVKKEDLVPSFRQASHLLKGFESVTLNHIPRKENRMVDALANLVNSVSNDAVRLRIFPLSLCDTGKDWLQSLPTGSITTWAVLTQKFLTKYFPPTKTAKMLNDITSFVQLDRESYDAWERFKSMLRKCPHHELLLWSQVQTFYNGVTLANRVTIDAAAGGTIMKKLPSEAFNIIYEIATNQYSYGQERADKRVAGIHSIDAVSALSAQMNAQMTALTHNVENFGAAMWNGAPNGPCGACGQIGHLSQDCQVGNPNIVNEVANFVSDGGRSNFNPYSNTYNSGWRSHPNFSWSNNHQQGLAEHHQPRQVQPPQEKKSNLEDMLSKFIAAADTQFQNQDASLQSQEASLQNLKVQMGQLVSIVAGRKEGPLPRDTEKNRKEQVNAITLKNGKTLGEEPLKEQWRKHRTNERRNPRRK